MVSKKMEGLAFGAYLYVVVLSFINVFWYPSHSYLPPLMWYQFYPFCMMVGFDISLIWWEGDVAEKVLLWLVIGSAIVGIFTHLFYIMITFQIIDKGGGSLVEFYGNKTYDGIYNYTNMFSPSVNRSVITTIKQPSPLEPVSGQGYFITLLVLVWINFIWLIVRFGTACARLSKLRKLDTKHEKSVWERHFNPFTMKTIRIRLAVQGLSMIGLIWGVFLTFLGFDLLVSSAILLTAFTNPNCYVMMMLAMSVFPPIPESEDSEPEKGGDESIQVRIKKNRNRFKRCGCGRCLFIDIGHRAMTWLMGLFFGLGFSIYSMVNGYIWRDQNSLPKVCDLSDMKNFTDRLTGKNLTLYFKSDSGLFIERVSYTNSPLGFEAWNCVDDYSNIFIVSFGILNLILAFVATFHDEIPGADDDRQKEAVRKEEEAADEEKKALAAIPVLADLHYSDFKSYPIQSDLKGRFEYALLKNRKKT
jgi:hypothetical protein